MYLQRNSTFFAAFLISAFALFAPVVAFAQLVPCDGVECDLGHFIQLLNNIINWAILVAPFLAGIAFAVAGFLYFTSRGNPQQIKQAHEIFFNTFIGLVLVLAAWLIVEAILAGLGATNFVSNVFG